jgi:hypothetical protein
VNEKKSDGGTLYHPWTMPSKKNDNGDGRVEGEESIMQGIDMASF